MAIRVKYPNTVVILISHPTGNENFRNTALALHQSGLLGGVWTCLGWAKLGIANSVVPASFLKTFGRRSVPDSVRDQTQYDPFLEASRLLFGQNRNGSEKCSKEKQTRVEAVYRRLDLVVAREIESNTRIRGVYCYEDGASQSFVSAKMRGARTLYELPMGYWRAWHSILDEEAQLQPEWADTLDGKTDSHQKLDNKEIEMENADGVIVASTFAKSTLSKSNFTGPVHVIPYGSPRPRLVSPNVEKSSKLKVIFVGSLSQRKGLSYLFEAIKLLRGVVQLTVVGRSTNTKCQALERELQKHTWLQSLSHPEVLTEMRKSDVLVFPSLFEGFGLVISEALSQGLPVITTPNTAGPDLIREGKNGFVVPIRSSLAIAEKMELLASDHMLLAKMKAEALKIASFASWANYRESFVKMVTS